MKYLVYVLEHVMNKTTEEIEVVPEPDAVFWNDHGRDSSVFMLI